MRVYDPHDKKMKLFQATALHFGAVRSAHSFLRCAGAIWWLGVVACKLFWTSFYDDHIALISRSSHLSNCLDGFSPRRVTSACLLGTAVKRWAWSSIWGSLQRLHIYFKHGVQSFWAVRWAGQNVGRVVLALKDGTAPLWADAICRFSDLWQDKQEVHAYFSRFQRR